MCSILSMRRESEQVINLRCTLVRRKSSGAGLCLSTARPGRTMGRMPISRGKAKTAPTSRVETSMT